uniref:F-box domain-containing protein n=1 Tax=Trichobilharzia regenti TaxID=157069 RepID=A0AA85JHB6_TRIRE|nr:unnamed protein product [Trichobilharzia regenti]
MMSCFSPETEFYVIRETRSTIYYTGLRRESTFDAHLMCTLPFEIRSRILSLLSINDLISLSDSCEEFRRVVEAYCLSKSCRQLSHFYNPHDHESSVTDGLIELTNFYSSVGILFNCIFKGASLCCTLEMLKSNLKRHLPDLMRQFPLQNRRSQVYGRNRKICSMACYRCPSLYLYGIFLKELTSGWSENATDRVFKILVHVCFNQNFWLRLSRVLSQRPAADRRSELAIRLFMRKVFLDPVALPFVDEQNHSPFYTGCRKGTYTLTGNNSLVVEDDSSQEEGRVETKSRRLKKTEDAILLQNPRAAAANSYYNSAGPSTNSVKSAKSSRYVAGPSSSSVVLPSQVSSFRSSEPSWKYNWKASGILKKILKNFDVKKQARLLFILYGPISRGYLMWRTVCRNTAADGNQLLTCFGELGGVICNMFYSGLWTSADVIRIFDNITVLPNEWLSENIACLMYCSGPNVGSVIMRNKSRKGKFSEAARTLTSLCLVQVKIKAKPKYFVPLITETFNAAKKNDKPRFLDQLSESFQNIMFELYEEDGVGM